MLTKSLTVAAIKNGSVIDHIAAGSALKIIHLLGLAKHKKKVSVGLNLPGKRTTIKDLIKVEDRELTPEEANQVAILAPHATINIISDYAVVKKFQVEIPEVIESVIVCPNPNCVTNHEPMKSFFYVQQNQDQILLTCKYCRKCFTQDDIKKYKTS